MAIMAPAAPRRLAIETPILLDALVTKSILSLSVLLIFGSLLRGRFLGRHFNKAGNSLGVGEALPNGLGSK